MNPAALAETHPTCRKNEAGEPLLPNGTPWRQQLLMLGLSSKLLVDAEKSLYIRKVRQLSSPCVSGRRAIQSIVETPGLSSAGHAKQRSDLCNVLDALLLCQPGSCNLS